MRLLTAQRHQVRLEGAPNKTGSELGSLRWALDHGEKFGSYFKNNRKQKLVTKTYRHGSVYGKYLK